MIRKKLLTLLFCLSAFASAMAQTGTLTGRIVDANTKEPLIGATVVIVGTYKGAATDLEGNYTIAGIKHGDYSIKLSYVGYIDKEYTGIKIGKDETKVLNAEMKEQGKTLETIEIIGERAVVDLESGKSEVRIGAQDIKEMTARSVQDVVALQAGVSQSPDGLQIRGGRVYETQYVVDGINAGDPLAGTGFGVQVSSNAIQDVTLVTGGSGAEYNANSGVVLTRIKEGGETLQVFGRWQRDNFGSGVNRGPAWNSDIIDLNLGTPIPGTKKKLRFFTSLNVSTNDTYFRVQAKQLRSSIIDNEKVWAPRQDNSWSNTFKLTYQLSQSTKLSITNQHSLLVNQNTRTLQIIGFDAIVVPGFQYPFTQQPDNATTYTHQTNLTAFNLQHRFSPRIAFNVDAGRLFVNLRADANGRPFRDASANQVYDPQSIVTDPIQVFNPNAPDIVFVVPGNGFFNNGGISTAWHDHWVQEYTLKYKFTYNSANRVHSMTAGHEHRQQSMQWIDVTRPWVGAPVTLPDGTTIPSTSIGSSSDVWKVKPRQGGFFYQDEIRYKGIIATLGTRLEYWAPGKLADNSIKDSTAPVTDQIRKDYLNQTTPLLGVRWKARLLPRLNVSFPVTENNVMYFNYSHNMRVPHPRFVYAGLDPVFQDRSFLSDLGNPNLNPEVAVAYELGIKSQINRDFGVTFTAFYKDQFDYIVNRTLVVRDQTGQFVEKTFSINQDYARIRGAEILGNYRLSRRFRVMANGSFQVATGKSNSAIDSRLQIKNTGQVNTTKEQFLAWDRPFDLKGTLIYTPDTSDVLFGMQLRGLRFFMAATYKSGLRYTPARFTGYVDNDPAKRPIWETIETSPNSKIGSSWFWTDIRITKDFYVTSKLRASFSVDILNVFNNKNAQIINPVTGKAYTNGDPLLFTSRDPVYPGPLDSGLPSNNPARYLPPRQILYGISVTF